MSGPPRRVAAIGDGGVVLFEDGRWADAAHSAAAVPMLKRRDVVDAGLADVEPRPLP